MLASLPLRLALAPILVPQALGVRRRALVLPEAAGPRQGVVGQGPRLNLLILGDSSAAGVGATHQGEALAGRLVAELARDFTVQWQLEARTGATSAQTLARLKRLETGPLDAAVTALGVNDLTRQVPLGRWRAQQDAIAQELAQRGAAIVLRTGVPPMARFPLLPRPLRDVLGAQARRFNAALAADSGPGRAMLPFDAVPLDPGLMAADGFHPGPALYALWAQALAGALRAALALEARSCDDSAKETRHV